jgi:hypothetical protein
MVTQISSKAEAPARYVSKAKKRWRADADITKVPPKSREPEVPDAELLEEEEVVCEVVEVLLEDGAASVVEIEVEEAHEEEEDLTLLQEAPGVRVRASREAVRVLGEGEDSSSCSTTAFRGIGYHCGKIVRS